MNSSTPRNTAGLVKLIEDSLGRTAPSLELMQVTKPRGAVIHVGDGIAHVVGLNQFRAGEGVLALHNLPSVPVGSSLLGRIVDPLGIPLDDGPALEKRESQPLFRPAPEFVERKGVDRPLHTGIMVIDAAIPIGRGQRELESADGTTLGSRPPQT